MTEREQFFRGIKTTKRKMKNKYIAVCLLILLALLVAAVVNAQELFRPGPYKKGEMALDIYGSVFKAKANMGLAVSPPSQNAYWEYVRKIATVSPTNTPEQNSQAIESYINAMPEGYAGSLYVPAGNYHFARAINLYRKPIHLFGDNGTVFGNSTKFYFPANTDGIKIDRGGASIQETIIENICLIGGGGNGTAGNGLNINARVKIRDVTMKGFSQNGLLIWANMGEGGEASGSIIESCHSLENGHDGFLLGRVDANAITVINCDARDNGRYGFNEDSFLGNTYINCMAHYNKAGDFFVRDWANARSSFVSCYSEGGNKINKLGPLTTVTGGIWGTPYTIGSDPTLRTKSYIQQ